MQADARHVPVVPVVPVVSITANARAEQQGQAGVNAVVTKPFELDDLLAIVDRVWRSRAS
jgi:CheY-like chemotaxis protein